MLLESLIYESVVRTYSVNRRSDNHKRMNVDRLDQLRGIVFVGDVY